jgi:hypothetical protein
VSIIGPVFLQSEIQILGIKRNESLTERGVLANRRSNRHVTDSARFDRSELVLSEMTRISRTSIREAIQRLTREHLILSQRGLLVP